MTTDLVVAGRRLEVAAHPPTDASAPWVVFLHEGLGCAGQWRDFPARVAKATGCGTLVYSRWGYGGSDPRPAPWPSDFIDVEADTMLPGLLDAVGVTRPIFYGHSDGGTIALLFAARRPGACAGVVSVAAHVMLEEMSVSGIEGARARFAAGALRESLRRHHGRHTDDTFFGWADTWLHPGMRGWDMRPELRAVRCPVLVIQGRDDDFGTLAQVDAITQGVSGPSSALVLDHCGHTPHREQPKAVLAAVVEFVGGIQRQTHPGA
ncbi:MAG: alpha/beta hydrolase [Acidobacteria bacterium]|nr:alpha/beta hydrolase [Acidobacteriota bacterium]